MAEDHRDCWNDSERAGMSLTISTYTGSGSTYIVRDSMASRSKWSTDPSGTVGGSSIVSGGPAERVGDLTRNLQ